jgi:hypothetical protein
MPCLFALFAGIFPRLADIFIWIARPTYFNNAFNDKWWWVGRFVVKNIWKVLQLVGVRDPTSLQRISKEG